MVATATATTPKPNATKLPTLIDIIVDTREQLPWALDPAMFRVTSQRLATGDYSIRGLEEVVSIERKSLGDFCQTVIHDWIRFRKELNRLSSFDVALIVVEADAADVMHHRYDSEANPSSVMGRAASIFLDHGVPVMWWGPRAQAIKLVEQFLYLTYKRLA